MLCCWTRQRSEHSVPRSSLLSPPSAHLELEALLQSAPTQAYLTFASSTLAAHLGQCAVARPKSASTRSFHPLLLLHLQLHFTSAAVALSTRIPLSTKAHAEHTCPILPSRNAFLRCPRRTHLVKEYATAVQAVRDPCSEPVGPACRGARAVKDAGSHVRCLRPACRRRSTHKCHPARLARLAQPSCPSCNVHQRCAEPQQHAPDTVVDLLLTQHGAEV